MRWLWISVMVLGFAAGTLAGGTSCLVDRKSNDFECSTEADCDGGRACQGGYCVTVDAPLPGACDTLCPALGGVCEDDTCVFDSPSSSVSCPSGIPCEIHCDGTGDCSGIVSCGNASRCTITCDGDGSCRGSVSCGNAGSCDVSCGGTGSCENKIMCGSRRCDVTCAGDGSCDSGVSCSASCACDVSCTGSGACSTSSSCPGNQMCVAAPGCTSAANPCDSC